MDHSSKTLLQDCLSRLSVQRKVDGTEYHTHVSMVYPKGRYQMHVSQLEQFWELYCSYIMSNGTEIGLAEKPQQYLPIVVDIDIKLPETTCVDFPVYTKDDVKAIVSIYIDVIREIVKDVEDHELVCFVLEKPHYYVTTPESRYVKNGIHLHFPYIFLDKRDHHVHLLPRVLEKISQTTLFKNINISDPSTLIDKQYINVPWLMYGSHKPDGQPYKVSYILDSHSKEISMEHALYNYKVYDVNEKLVNIKGKEIYFLPRVLSIIPYNREVKKVKSSVACTAKLSVLTKQSAKKQLSTSLLDSEICENIKKAKQLLPLLSDHRANNRQDWITVGWILFNVSGGSLEGLELWLEFSSRCNEKFSETVCVYEWEHMETRSIGLGTLIFYAKNDNPKLYIQNIIYRKNDKMIIPDTHVDVANRLYELYGDEYVCASLKDNVWYKYEKHHWKETEGAVDLRMKISTVLVTETEEMLKSVCAQILNAQDEYDKAKYSKMHKALESLIKSLKSNPFKNSVIKECCDIFYKEDFLAKLDANRFLFGFQNGVYDLKENVLRPGIPDDYISTQSPLDYIEYDRLDTKVQEVYDCLNKTFPDKDVYKFFMDTTCEVFMGGNDRKLVLFWSGKGNNGKSVIQSFVEKILGPYAVKFPTSLVTGKRAQSSGCTPELARAGNGVRWAVIQEPDETEYINIGVLKELSGNDTFYARSLYKTGREINPMFKLLIVCNKQPKLPHIDQATINRLCVIPYESTFSDCAPSSIEEQMRTKVFPKVGNYIRDKVPELSQAFLWVLLDHFKHYNPSTIPTKVRVATDKYIERNDNYRQFVEEYITECDSGKITILEIYPLFKEWIRTSVPNTQVPARIDVQDYFESAWGPSTRGVWKGRKIKSAGFSDDVQPDTSIDFMPPI